MGKIEKFSFQFDVEIRFETSKSKSDHDGSNRKHMPFGLVNEKKRKEKQKCRSSLLKGYIYY